MNKLSSYLLGGTGSPVDEDKVSFLAKRASKRYVEEGTKLSSAVSEAVEGEDLTREQVQRVCEIANQETFRSLFEKQDDKNVTFPLAKLSEVVGSPKAATHRSPSPALTSSDPAYYCPGSGGVDVLVEIFGATEKTAGGRGIVKEGRLAAATYDPGEADVKRLKKFHGSAWKSALWQSRGGLGAPKVHAKAGTVDLDDVKPPGASSFTPKAPGMPTIKSASPYDLEDPHAELARTRERLMGVQEHTQSKLSHLTIAEETARTDLEHEVEQVVLGGESFGSIVSALAPFVKDEDLFRKTAAALGSHLVERGIARRPELVADMDKLSAQRCPNPEHPVVTTWLGYQTLHERTGILKKACRITTREQARVDAVLGVTP